MTFDWKLGATIAVICVLLSSGDAGPVEPQYNEYAQMVLEDLQAQQLSRGLFDGLEPKCWLEDFTAACCIKVEYRTGKKNKKGKDIMGKHKACVEAGIHFERVQAFMRAVHDGKVIGKELKYDIGELCWPLPPPLDQLSICAWLWHAEINPKNNTAEACFILRFTKALHIRFDCIRWNDGQFEMHSRILPKKEQPMFELYVSLKKVKFTIKNNTLIQIWHSLKKVWEKIKGLFGKSKDMNSWVTKTYDN